MPCARPKLRGRAKVDGEDRGRDIRRGRCEESTAVLDRPSKVNSALESILALGKTRQGHRKPDENGTEPVGEAEPQVAFYCRI